jgi:hypothetical protein
MTTSDYVEFLETKEQTAPAVGIEVSAVSDALFPFQQAVVRWALRRGKAAIFANTGLGKTAMQLEWARQVAAHTGGNVLLLAPLAVAKQTQAEALKLLGLDVQLVRELADVRPGVNVCNYDRLHLLSEADWDGIVLDESSILKAYDGKRRTAIIDGFASVPFKLACTATPAPNDFTELGNHSQFLDVMSRTEMLAKFFVHDGGSTQDWRIKGHAVGAFWQWVCSWAAVVGNPSDIGFDGAKFVLPTLNTQVVSIGKGSAPKGVLFAETAGMDLQARRKARKASTGDRVQKIAEMVAKQSSEPWIIWCDLNDEAEQLAEAIPGAVNVHGGMSVDEKEAALEDFSTGKIKVMISKPKIAGFGLNWQHCARMAFCGLSDSFEAFYQAVRRCWRFGQKREVDVWIVVSDAEMVSVDNVMGKGGRAEEMTREVASLTGQAVRSNLKGSIVTKDNYREDECKGKDWEVRLGDCVELVGKMPSDSVGYSVFSPPFASLYTYSPSHRDMGNCASHGEFFEHFRFLVAELLRVTKPGRLLSFHCMNLPTSKVRDGYIGITDFRGELIRTFVAEGWIYHSEVVVWKDPVTAMQRTKALGLLHKQIRKDSCMSRQGIPDYVVTMRKPGDNPDPVTNTAESFPVSDWQKYASPVWMDINPSDTLQERSARDEADEKHICPLQLEVIRRCLRLWSKPGDLVLSPFAGIGSEGYEAVKMGRRFIGCELKETYWKQACANLRIAEQSKRQGSLFDAQEETDARP